MEIESHIDHSKGLDVSVYKKFLSSDEENTLFDAVKDLPWYRVKYESERHKNQCETPCWTNMFGGFPELKPYQPIPSCLQEICDKISEHTGAQYNAILVRLYFDGNDNIAWHTDGRTFLGSEPNIASLSLGCKSSFQLRKMTNVWPTTQSPNGGVDKTVPQINMSVAGGDLMIMRGRTQQEWHHRVPKEAYRGPRININFRQILPERSEISLRGVRAFYKYMVSGDCKTENWDITAPAFSYSDIVKKQGPLMSFFKSPRSGSQLEKRKAPSSSSPPLVGNTDSSSTGTNDITTDSSPKGVTDTLLINTSSGFEQEQVLEDVKRIKCLHAISVPVEHDSAGSRHSPPVFSDSSQSVRTHTADSLSSTSSKWVCEVCTFINEEVVLSEVNVPCGLGISSRVCSMCGHSFSSNKPPSSASGSTPSSNKASTYQTSRNSSCGPKITQFFLKRGDNV